jgi:hypothetical protein
MSKVGSLILPPPHPTFSRVIAKECSSATLKVSRRIFLSNKFKVPLTLAFIIYMTLGFAA